MSWKAKIRDPECELCPLHQSAEHVCLMGSGSRKAQVMIVGEAPGAREDESATAFVGPAGQLLDELLEEAGISRDECYITNAAKCRPPDNRTPEPAEIKICVSQYLTQEFDKVQPRWILLLGNSALKGVVGRTGITKFRGSTFQIGEATAFAAFHPAYALRNPRHLEPIRADFRRFGRLVRGEPEYTQGTKTKIVYTPKQLKWLRSQMMDKEVLSVDIETNYDNTRKCYYKPWEEGAAIIMLSVSWQPGQAVVVPLHQKYSPFHNNWRAVLRFLKPALERQDAKYIMQNGKFDVRWMAFFGVFMSLTFDTMLAAHILDENRPKALESLSSVLLGVAPWKYDLRFAYEDNLRKLSIYAGKDTDHTLRLYYLFRQQLIDQPRLLRVFTKLMMPASDALVHVETTGMWLDVKRAKAVQAAVAKRKEEVRQQFLEYVPEYNRAIINLNSFPQLAHLFFTELKLPIVERTKKGAPSTNESVMMVLAAKHPAPKILLEYRKWKGHLEKVTSWLEAAKFKDRIHTTYKLFGTVTGRLSSEDPNLQQVPREGVMRTCFGAPPGWRFIEADYSQIELRIIAWLSGDRTMLSTFLRGEDIHSKTAREVSGIHSRELSKEERKRAKPVNFGFSYGMGAERMVTYARDNYEVELSLEEAERFRERFFQTYTRLRPWHDRQRRLVERYERVQSPIGRIRHLPDVRSQDRSVRADAGRQAINSPVQSFASDLMLLSLVRLDALLPSRVARVVGTVHDSLLFEAREDHVSEVVSTIRSVMEDMKYVKKLFGVDFTVPIEVDIKVSQHWGGDD